MVVKKKINLLLVIAILFSIMMVGCQEKSDPKQSQTAFKELTKEIVKEGIEADYMAMHQLIAYPENYGVDTKQVEVSLGGGTIWQEEDIEDQMDSLTKRKKKLDDINRNDLKKEQQETYDILKDQMEIEEASLAKELVYFTNVFSPSHGIQANVVLSLNDYVFYSEQDAKDMVSLIKSVKPLFEDQIEYARKQKEAGLFMSDYTVDRTLEYCDKVLYEDLGETMLTNIKANLDKLDGIDAQSKEMYKQQYEEAYQSTFIPAYLELKEDLTKLKSKDNRHEGLSHFEHGKEAYELLYRMYTGSSLSIEEAIKMLDERMDDTVKDMRSTLLANIDDLEQLLDENQTFEAGFNSYESMLEALIKWSEESYPEIKMPQYEMVGSNLIPDGVGAYYALPYLDKDNVNTMRVNAKNDEEIDSLQTFYYVAHEGVPGHMYFYNYVLQKNKEPNRLLLANYLGFSEGFANYSATYALQASPSSKIIKEMMRYNFDINWIISSRIDIGIHYEGWSIKELKKYLAQYGLGEIANEEFYDNAISDPGVSLSYGIGYFEVLELREKAEEKLDDKFDAKEFNEALLSIGSAPFKMIEEKIDEYIEVNK